MSAAAAALTAANSDPNEYPILPHWGELIFGLVTFAIFYVIVRRAVVPRLETIFGSYCPACDAANPPQAQSAPSLRPSPHAWRIGLLICIGLVVLGLLVAVISQM